MILKGLAKDPAARHDDAAALRDALQECADAGRWTQEQTRQWWQAHPEIIAETGSEASDSTISSIETMIDPAGQAGASD